uniref:chymotrypsin n=1 Tax=Sinocyclocheilus grahami TaxID=75366 RepID=A0A672JV36_SINGR
LMLLSKVVLKKLILSFLPHSCLMNNVLCSVITGCGVPAIKPQTIGSRIVNGQNAISGSWPWQVSLQVTLPNSFHFCGGSLINENWVLTAAHCDKLVSKLSLVTIHLLFLYVQVITHPLYNRATFNNDIALLKLSAPVTFTPRISPVCLAPSNSSILPGTRCFTTGWGQTATTSHPEILQQTGVPIISPAVCRQIWGQNRITDAMICAGASGSSSCQVYEDKSRRNTLPYQCCCCSISNVCFSQGDSGGPLVCEISGVWTLVGSVSWETSTCDTRFPAVYARISQLRSWIDMTIASN